MPSITNLTVPQRAKPMLRWLANLDGPTADAVLTALTSTEEFRSTSELTSRLAEVDGVGATAAEEFVAVLFALSAMHYSHNWPIADIVETIADMPTLEIQEEARPAFQARLTSALTTAPVVGLAKAVDVAYEHDNLFHTARILTDIRPVFGDEPTEGALGAVVIHTLRLNYYRRTRLDTFSIAMSDSELDELEIAVFRAKEKREAIRRLMTTASLVGFETETEH